MNEITTPTGTLHVMMRFQTAAKAARSAAATARKYGPKFAVTEDRRPEGGGNAYPYAVVTPYAYPYQDR